MRSQLARHAGRASRGLAQPHARNISVSALSLSGERNRRPRPKHAPLCIARPASTRTLFGGFKKPPRDVKDHRVLPGYDQLLLYSASETDKTRPPPTHTLITALRAFSKAANRRRRPINSTQAFCFLRTLVYLTETGQILGEGGVFLRDGPLNAEDFKRFQNLARRKPRRGDVESHLELVRVTYKCECLLDKAGTQRNSYMFRRYVEALAQLGAATEAFELLSTATTGDTTLRLNDQALWLKILEGLAEQGNEAALTQKASELQLSRWNTCQLQKIMVAFFAARGDVDAVFTWYEKCRCDPAYGTLVELLRLARQRPEAVERVNAIFHKICGDPRVKPPRHLWDAILRWAVSILGKDVDGIDEMARGLREHGYPNTQTINSLIETAIELKNPALAERIWLWSIKHRISHDIRSYSLQLEYRLEANDIMGARSAFDALVAHPRQFDEPAQTEDDLEDSPRGEPPREDPIFDDYTTSVLNSYLRALCMDLTQGPRLLSTLVQIEEFEVTLEAETTAALCVFFLKTDQQYELMDTLSLHALQYSLEERAIVRGELVKYCLDMSNSTARVWDGYALLREYFPDTDRASRVQIMDAFFEKRKRPDMALLVFGHMRAQDNPKIRPDKAAYTRAFEQLGRYPDSQSLSMVHNMLKMDTTVQPDTRLYNALMMAYTGCGDPETSLEFWREISGSPDGPTYDSLAIFFWTCEKLPFGDQKAQEVWGKMQRMEVEVPEYVFAAYCGAIAGNGDVDQVKSLLKGMKGTVGYYPNTSMLRVAFNALPGKELQDVFEEWAKHDYPELWAKLEAAVPRVKTAGLEATEFRHPRDELKA